MVVTGAGNNANDRIEVVSETDETTSASTTNVSNLPMIFENTKKERRPNIRPYASCSNRIVKKGGRSNVELNKIPHKEFRYIKDIGNTLLNTRWRWILISLCIANAIAYVTFAGLWLLASTLGGDLDDVIKDGESHPCVVVGSSSFTSFLLLSIETLSTIGYGTRYPMECHAAWIVITLQALTAITIEGALVTAVFVKMSRPYNKDPTSLFSKKAVISMRDGVLCLIFRVRDIYGKHWAKTMVKAILIKRRISPEGEPLPYYFENIKLDKHGLLFWPQEIIHKITPESPLWTMSPSNLYKSRFEIMIILEGDSVVTGQPSQSQTSYMNKEISWGYRFVPCVEYDKDECKYLIQHEKFNDVEECATPLCSAQELSGLLIEASKPNEMWDYDVMSALSSPASRRSDNSLLSAFKFPTYRTKKNDIDGILRESLYNRQFSGVTLETINSVENLAASNNSLDAHEKTKEDKDVPMSTSF